MKNLYIMLNKLKKIYIYSWVYYKLDSICLIYKSPGISTYILEIFYNVIALRYLILIVNIESINNEKI